MMKKFKKDIILFALLIIYFIFGSITHIYIPCPINYIFHIYCPGCGVTRLIINLIHLDFIKAFRSNQLIFILLPFGIILYIDYVISRIKNKEALYKKININIYYIVIILLVIFGIIRNFIGVLQPI